MFFGVHKHGKSKKARYFWILNSLGLFFCGNFADVPGTLSANGIMNAASFIGNGGKVPPGVGNEGVPPG